MLEFLIGNYVVDRHNHKKKIREGFADNMTELPVFDVSDGNAVAALIVSLIISFITAYIAYQCNKYENAGVKFLITIFAFFFSGIYLIYYFIIYVILDAECSGTNDFLKSATKVVKKKGKKGRKKSN